MLNFVNVATPFEIKKYIDEFDLKNSTWIVSDLKSKLDIQNHCINKYGFFLDDSILRISDFWRLWLRRLSPEMSIVSSDFIKALVQNFMLSEAFEKVQKDLDIQAHQYTTVYNYLSELAPLLLSPQSDEIMREWMQTQNKSWFKWYFIARLSLNYLVKEKKVIDSLWVPSFIQNLDANLFQWDKHIYLDLGSEMTSVEMGLFQQLSQKFDVTVFVPDPIWKDKYKFLLNTYSTNQGFSTVETSMTSIKNQPLDLSTYLRFSTEALEVKYIVHQIRQWIENGVALNQIGLVSPRVEEYWPILKIHLDEEGIAYNKKNVTTLLSLGTFQLLLAKIKSYSTAVSWESLEQAYYGQVGQNENLEFEKFKAQLSELTDAEDLIRNEDIKKVFYNKVNLSDKMGRLYFLAFIFKSWIDLGLNYQTEADYTECLEVAFKDFLSRSIEMELSLEQWLKVFTSGLSKKEITLKKASVHGVDIGTSNSSHLLDVQYVIWFGLDESAFKKNAITMVPLQDIEELKFKFDFPIPYPEESHAEFNIRWYSQYQFQQQIFTCSLASAKAEPLSASALILENNIMPDVEFDLELQATRIDSLQITQAAQEKSQKLLNELHQHKISVPEFRPEELSMTDFINYDHCGFKLLAAKGFKLRDYPTLSIDLDPRQRGSLAHALFEYLVQGKKYRTFQSKEIEDFLDQKRLEFRMYPHMNDFWTLQKKKLLNVAVQFCSFENNRIGSVAIQHLVEQSFELKLQNLSIKGRIDRIDLYPNQTAIIYDYKRSESAATSYGVDWMDKREFQMLFYLLAAQDVLNIKDGGAYYFFYKNMRVYKGLLDVETKDESHLHSTIEITKKAQVSSADYNQLKVDFKNYIYELEKTLSQSDFSAIPFDASICEKCDWNRLCRAAHL